MKKKANWFIWYIWKPLSRAFWLIVGTAQDMGVIISDKVYALTMLIIGTVVTVASFTLTV